jgi:hypothetical protein
MNRRVTMSVKVYFRDSKQVKTVKYRNDYLTNYQRIQAKYNDLQQYYDRFNAKVISYTVYDMNTGEVIKQWVHNKKN